MLWSSSASAVDRRPVSTLTIAALPCKDPSKLSRLYLLMSAVTTRILATGAYLPERVVPNEALTQFPAATLPLIAEKTGISARRYAADDESTSDLCAKAARQCLERADLAPDDV